MSEICGISVSLRIHHARFWRGKVMVGEARRNPLTGGVTVQIIGQEPRHLPEFGAWSFDNLSKTAREMEAA